MKKSLLLVFLFSSACSNGIWYKAGATQDELAKAKYQCLKDSQQSQSSAYGSSSGGAFNGSGYYQSSSGEVTNWDLFNACMNAKGFTWKEIEKKKK
jgi:hypothetical protein